MTAPDPLQQLLAERACERLIIEFVHHFDLGNPASVADLFTPDGVWEWPHGHRRIQGRDALRAYFGSRPADRLSRRLMTNILVDVASMTSATATSYLATYRWTATPKAPSLRAYPPTSGTTRTPSAASTARGYWPPAASSCLSEPTQNASHPRARHPDPTVHQACRRHEPTAA